MELVKVNILAMLLIVIEGFLTNLLNKLSSLNFV